MSYQWCEECYDLVMPDRRDGRAWCPLCGHETQWVEIVIARLERRLSELQAAVDAATRRRDASDEM